MTKKISKRSPVKQIGDAKLILGDSIKVLAEMEPETVDLVFADPPYNLSNDGYTVHAGKRVSVNKGDWDRSEGV